MEEASVTLHEGAPSKRVQQRKALTDHAKQRTAGDAIKAQRCVSNGNRPTGKCPAIDPTKKHTGHALKAQGACNRRQDGKRCKPKRTK